MRASRLVSILMLLQTRGRVTARMLASHLEVSMRTVYRDIDELSAAGVPVIVERGATGGFELLGGWRTNLTGLTSSESRSLLVPRLPGPLAELGLDDTMASTQLKLLAALPREWQAEAHRISSRFHVDLAGWYRQLGPVPHLRTLADAVWAERRVKIRYESWNGVVERELEPLGLVVKAGDWYVVALPHASATPHRRQPSPRTYRVSNIRALTVEDGFVRPKAFDLAAYWSESTRRFEREINRGTAEVRLTPRGRQLLRNASAAVEHAIDQAANSAAAADPSDPAVTVSRGATGWLQVVIPIESIEHAAGQLLALGADVEVVKPAELRTRMGDTARAVAAIYARREPAATATATGTAKRRRANRP